MVTATNDLTTAKRRLILRDSLAFLTLALATVVLFAITLFLFKSFTQHREDLAVRWSDRGRLALQQGKPDQAIVALRTALSYAPGTRAYEVLLAQALGEAGRTEESYNYFLGLWETEPGDGFTNLQLARLAAKKSDREDAVRFYRAAIYGTWEGDGVVRRAQVRLELARYLISAHDLAGARMEALTAGGNVPDNPDFDLALGQILEQAEDPTDAASYYGKALGARPGDRNALELAGRLAFASADYVTAHRDLDGALRGAASLLPHAAEDKTMQAESERYLALNPSADMPVRDRVDRILSIQAIARKRMDACMAMPENTSAPLRDLSARWAAPGTTADKRALLRSVDVQASTLELAYGTEQLSRQMCSVPPTPDDAVLLLLMKSAPPAQTGASTHAMGAR